MNGMGRGKLKVSFKDPEKKRVYFREYMRRRRAAVKPEQEPVLNPAQEAPGPPQRLDWTRPYTTEGRRRNHYLVQDGFKFDPKTGELVGEARELFLRPKFQ